MKTLSKCVGLFDEVEIHLTILFLQGVKTHTNTVKQRCRCSLPFQQSSLPAGRMRFFGRSQWSQSNWPDVTE